MESLDYRFEKLDNASRTGYLIAGFITNTLSIEEREELDAFVLASEYNMQLFEDMTDETRVDEFLRWIATRDTESKLKDTKRRLKFKKRHVVSLWQYAAAACLLVLIGFFVFRFYQEDEVIPDRTVVIKEDILPGAAAAELRLPGDRIVKLDEISDTVINGIAIENGQIIYNTETDTALHEIIIPRKGFYKLVLPDGTKVWLNNESSIKYPGSFAGDRREVVVTGETFFEVSKDPLRPFIVHAGTRRIQAIGTAFNINSFDQTVTLTEGVIDVDDTNKKVRMKPGQQIGADGNVSVVDVRPVVAWTSNRFRFKNAKLEEIMPQLERWYDCRVVYDDKVGYHFNATIDRSVPVSRVLQLLEGTEHVHFTIQGDVINVRK